MALPPFADFLSRRVVIKGELADFAAFGGPPGLAVLLSSAGALVAKSASKGVHAYFIGASEEGRSWHRRQLVTYPGAQFLTEGDLAGGTLGLASAAVAAPIVGIKRPRKAAAQKIEFEYDDAAADAADGGADGALFGGVTAVAGDPEGPVIALGGARPLPTARPAAASARRTSIGAGKRSTESVCRGLSPEQLAYAGGAFPLPAAADKREASWRSAISVASSDRLRRVGEQRMFLVDRRMIYAPGTGAPSSSSLSTEAPAAPAVAAEFDLLGSTGNVYTVTIGPRNRCTCPDYAKAAVCKHVLFVMLKVLRVPAAHPLLWQAALLPNELEYIFAHAPEPGAAAAGGVLASDAARAAVAAATGRALSIEPAPDAGAGALPPPAAAGAPAATAHEPTADCPICYEELGADASALVSCGVCRNSLHAQCQEAWAVNKIKGGRPADCVFCRAPWPVVPAAGGAGAAVAAVAGVAQSGDYLNVAPLVGVSSVREPTAGMLLASLYRGSMFQ